MKPGRWFLVPILFTAALNASPANADATPSASVGAQELLDRHAALAPQLANNPFGRPLVLQSQEGSRRVGGDVYAVVDFPFATVKQALSSANSWCEVLILHLNTKSCRAGQGDALSVRVGRKGADAEDAFALQFGYRLLASRPDYLAAQVSAPTGPLGSHDYRIELQAAPLGANRSFLRLRYSYGFGTAAKLATRGYLATAGSGKIGFTRSGKGYVRGLRGAIERNTMRYYLAVESYLASLEQPPGRRFLARIERWFDATERYRAQLHEMERDEYVAMKRREYARQQAVASN